MDIWDFQVIVIASFIVMIHLPSLRALLRFAGLPRVVCTQPLRRPARQIVRAGALRQGGSSRSRQLVLPRSGGIFYIYTEVNTPMCADHCKLSLARGFELWWKMTYLDECSFFFLLTTEFHNSCVSTVGTDKSRIRSP